MECTIHAQREVLPGGNPAEVSLMPPILASNHTLGRKTPKILAIGVLAAGALFLTGCSNTAAEQVVATTNPPSTTNAPPTNLTSLQDVRKSHSYLSGKECQSPETKRVSASMTVEVVVCDHAPSLKLVAVVGSSAIGFSEAVSRFRGASQAMGENWMVAVTPGTLGINDYRISGIDRTELEAEGIAKKQNGWVEVSPNFKDFYR